jgi:hypothetical protein
LKMCCRICSRKATRIYICLRLPARPSGEYRGPGWRRCVGIRAAILEDQRGPGR